MTGNRVEEPVGISRGAGKPVPMVPVQNGRTAKAITLMSIAEREVSISNRLGLHARPAMQFVDLANQFASRIAVEKRCSEPYEVDGKSVMQMITLEAGAGTRLKISAEGDDAQRAVDELAALVESGFGED